MLQKIKAFITKLHEKRAQVKCYNGMEKAGVAVFGMCSGFFLERPRKETCSRCPYFRDVRGGKNDDDMLYPQG